VIYLDLWLVARIFTLLKMVSNNLAICLVNKKEFLKMIKRTFAKGEKSWVFAGMFYTFFQAFAPQLCATYHL